MGGGDGDGRREKRKEGGLEKNMKSKDDVSNSVGVLWDDGRWSI